jgi:hypothetical protein
MLNVIMLSVIALSAAMPNVVTLNVVSLNGNIQSIAAPNFFSSEGQFVELLTTRRATRRFKV